MAPKVKCYTRKTTKEEPPRTYVTCNNNVKQETKAKSKSKSLEEEARERTAKDGIPRIVKDGKILKKKPIKFNVKPPPEPKKKPIKFNVKPPPKPAPKSGREFLDTLKADIKKPKPAPKKFKIKAKEVVEITTDQQLKKLGELMGKYYRGEPVLYTCESSLEIYFYYQILRRNKNDCAMAIYHNDKLVAIDEVSIDARVRISFDITQIMRFNDEIVATYLKCEKNKKILCVPFLVANRKHLNMLVFNFYRGKLEWYEPHGAVYANAKLKGSPEHFLGELAKDCGLELEESIASCPKLSKKIKDEALKNIEIHEKKLDDAIGTSRSMKDYRKRLLKYLTSQKKLVGDRKGLQSFDGTKVQKEEKARIAGMYIKDPHGFCCMWSYLYMDFRLKYPKLEPNALGQLLFDKFSNNLEENIRNFIRGFTQELMEQLFKSMDPREFKIITQGSTTSNARYKQYMEAEKKLRGIVLDYIKSKP